MQGRQVILRAYGQPFEISGVRLSLSRLNHGQPGVQAHPEIAHSIVFRGKCLIPSQFA